MKNRSRIFTMFVWIFFAISIAIFGSFIESQIINKGAEFGSNLFGDSVFLFFAAVNINVILLLLFVFLTFRSGVKLFVNNSKGVFGSRLNTKLVAAFLFFSLLPTVVLLYVSTKFVNTNFDKWLPQQYVEFTKNTMDSENKYHSQIYQLFSNQNPLRDNLNTFDFVKDIHKRKFIYLSPSIKLFESRIDQILSENKNEVGKKPIWLTFDEGRMAIVKKNSNYVFGIVTPKMLHPQWMMFKAGFPETQNAVHVLKLSYFLMLGVITLLIVFSATWLGFTIAREFTVPMQILSEATENIAMGNYSVRIDEIVSDDEMGTLARSFRSMVGDLQVEKERVDLFSSELKRKADELYVKSEFNEILLRNINASVIVLNENLFIELWNKRAEHLFRYNEKDIIGKHISDVINKELYEKSLKEIIFELKKSLNKKIEIEWLGKISELETQLQITLTIIESPSGKTGTILFINDISEFAKAQRMAAWRDVASRIAHEIKNPLTPIKLGAQRIQRKFVNTFNTAQKDVFNESIGIILHSAESIRILVDEFIKFARMPHSNLRIGNIVEAIYFSVKGFIGNPENVPLVFEVCVRGEKVKCVGEESCENLPVLKCNFDRDQLIRLFVNLIANAVIVSGAEHTPVIVCIDFAKDDSTIKIMVKDFGNGLSEEVKSRIFEPYFSTKKSGMGLGLAIVKQIVDEHFGQIYVEENTPKGTVFLVCLPAYEGA